MVAKMGDRLAIDMGRKLKGAVPPFLGGGTADRLEAKFHYAILVADRSEAGRRPVADMLARASFMLVIGQIPARCRSATSFGPVCDQDSVMEFGLCYLFINLERMKG